MQPTLPLVQCHICQLPLIPHPIPIYKKSGSMMCEHHGEFFIQHLRGDEPTAVFRSFLQQTKPRVHKPGNQGSPIRCDQTGVIYPSLQSAALDLDLDARQIAVQLSPKTRRKTVGGYSFTREDSLLPCDFPRL